MDGTRLFSMMSSDRTMGKEHKLEHRMSPMIMKKLLYFQDGRPMEQDAQSECEVFSGDIKKLPEHFSVYLL